VGLFASTSRSAGMIRAGYAYGGPWKGGRGAGRARRRLSVISGLKKRVHVNSSKEPLLTQVT